jgi:hypothetical protein
MRPSVSEQLSGMRRVLQEVVGPQVEAAYPRDMLDGVISTLDALASSWMDVPAFLRWDAEEMARLLDGQELPPEPHDPLDVRALEAWHAQLRWLLQEHVTELLANELTAHLKARAERFPVRPETRMPGQR